VKRPDGEADHSSHERGRRLGEKVLNECEVIFEILPRELAARLAARHAADGIEEVLQLLLVTHN
jgi:hypothetical protein